MPCCDRNGCDRLFRGRLVEADRRAYERGGLNARQRILLGPPGSRAGTLLDIGGGIGALALEHLVGGGEHAVVVDLSRDSLRAARDLAARRGLRDRIDVQYADAMYTDLAAADHVTLDRVVCCDPQGPALLARAAGLARRTLAFSYPSTQGWFRWLALGRRALNAAMRIFGHRYRFFLHDDDAVLAAATGHGHRVTEDSRVGMMRVIRLERPVDGPAEGAPDDAHGDAHGDRARSAPGEAPS